MRLTARWCRGGLVLLLFTELLLTLPCPWPWGQQHRQLQDPRHANDAAVWQGKQDSPHVYHSSKLLERCQASMRYNKEYEGYLTPTLALWGSAWGALASDPAAGWAAWQELMVTAKHPWAVYWAFWLAPESWHIMPRQSREDLDFLQEGLPVLLPLPATLDSNSSNNSSGSNSIKDWLSWVSRAVFGVGTVQPPWHVMCMSAVDADSLQPERLASCRVFLSSSADVAAGTFTILPDAPQAADARTCPAAAAVMGRSGSGTGCSVLGPGLVLGPLSRLLTRAAYSWWPTAVLVNVLGQLWRFTVPTGSLGRPLCTLLSRMQLLQDEASSKVVMLYALVVLVSARNWLYLATVAYKISRRLALLAHAPWRARLSGTALTFVGMFLGLWQSLLYVVLDIAIDVALAKLAIAALSRSALAAAVVWRVSLSLGLMEVRAGMKAWKLAKLVWSEARTLVVTPQAVLLQQQGLVAKLPRQNVNTVGSWPDPLPIPEEVDDLPVAEVPRGFICPITQAIMRQPALLLHDRTIAPSTYDKEAIMQWLAEHSTDPKNPGVQLCMKSVRLVYNGDLGRAIEDWVSAKAAASQQQRELQRQQQLLQAYQQPQLPGGLNLWRLSGRMEDLFHPVHPPQAQQQRQHVDGGSDYVEGKESDRESDHDSDSGSGEEPDEGVVQGGPAGASGRGPRRRQHRDPGGAAAAAGNAAGAGVGARRAAHAGGSILSDAGALMRTSSAALMQVASMDLPTVAVAGLTQLAAGTTRRVTTRAVSRQLQRQQQRQQRQEQRQEEQQQQQHQPRGYDQQSDSSGSSDEVESRHRGSRRSRQQHKTRGPGSSKQRRNAGSPSTPPEGGVRQRRSRSATVAAAAVEQ